MKKTLLLLCILAVSLGAMSQSQKPYTEDWDMIAEQYQTPEWFKDAKLGIFIHWGVYAVPAFGSEWYGRLMYADSAIYHGSGKKTKDGPSNIYEHHVKNWGHPSEFGYKDFIPMFKAENFNAQEWMDLFKKAGAKYVVPVAEHHDAFAMYNSSHTIYNSVDMGPKRDILEELKASCKINGLKFGASSHLAFNQDFFNRKEHLGNTDPKYSLLYGPNQAAYSAPLEDFKDLWFKRTKEIVDKYEPDIMWFDFGWDRAEYAQEHLKFTTYYYNQAQKWGKEVVLQGKNHRYESLRPGAFTFDMERSKSAKIRKFFWQTDTSVGKNSWGYVSNWISKETNTLVDDLVDIVSKNGNMLLNVGPKADGTIPYDQQKVLLEIGEWLSVNGEAIYGSRPFTIYGEGPTKIVEGHLTEGKNKDLGEEDIRYTTQGDQLYAFLMQWPSSNKTIIKTLAKGNPNYTQKITSVKMLGSDEVIKFKQTKNGLEVTMPSYRPCDFAYGLKIN